MQTETPLSIVTEIGATDSYQSLQDTASFPLSTVKHLTPITQGNGDQGKRTCSSGKDTPRMLTEPTAIDSAFVPRTETVITVPTVKYGKIVSFGDERKKSERGAQIYRTPASGIPSPTTIFQPAAGTHEVKTVCDYWTDAGPQILDSVKLVKTEPRIVDESEVRPALYDSPFNGTVLDLQSQVSKNYRNCLIT